MKKFIALFLIILFSSHLYAFSLLVGIKSSVSSMRVNDLQSGDEKIAQMHSTPQFYPAVGIRTKPNYIGKSNWGYFYQLDWSRYRLSRQKFDGIDDNDVGTEIKGYSVFAVPTLYYDFYKKEEWTFKAGLGIGAGYMSTKGSFKITQASHPEFNTLKAVNVNDFGIAYGIFFELLNEHHSFIVQNFIPSAKDANYEYAQDNVDIMYRYIFHLDLF